MVLSNPQVVHFVQGLSEIYFSEIFFQCEKFSGGKEFYQQSSMLSSFCDSGSIENGTIKKNWLITFFQF